jgi:hypothetical protein
MTVSKQKPKAASTALAASGLQLVTWTYFLLTACFSCLPARNAGAMDALI